MPIIPASKHTADLPDVVIDLRTFGDVDAFGASVARVQIIGHDGKIAWAHIGIKAPRNAEQGGKHKRVVLTLTAINEHDDVRREVSIRPWQVIDLDRLVLDRLTRMGAASAGQLAAFVKASTEDTSAALHRLRDAGKVAIYPGSLEWACA